MLPLSKRTPAANVLQLSPRRITTALCAFVGTIVLACLTASFFRFVLGVQHGPLDVIRLFNFGGEMTVASWMSSGLLFFSGVLLGVIGLLKVKDRFRPHWLILGAIFLLLSVDEACMLHERIGSLIQRRFKPGGLLYYGWVIPAILFVIVVGIAYTRFLLHLPRKTRRLVILSGASFVMGALILEMYEGKYESQYGSKTLFYGTMVAIEEILEIGGTVLFIHALLDYMGSHLGGVALLISGPDADAALEAES